MIELLRGGDALVKQFRNTRQGETRIEYHMRDSGVEIPPGAATLAIVSGYIEPTSDGLFGSASAQTFVLKKGAIERFDKLSHEDAEC
ncbi:hypothetical protein [Methylosinus sp. PW1]|uniref:hypothetical protein n=1 Tax=Methylosinus sp. PW1 TaxID=107636 RepID=UPI00056C4167|nr:hypothetical protein [Methylosinus sp. PW1]